MRPVHLSLCSSEQTPAGDFRGRPEIGALSFNVSFPQRYRRPVKLLIVDDSAIGRVVVQRTCLTVGLKVEDILFADNGQTALQRFERTACDAIVTDWHMPVMDGLTLVKEIRKRNARVPILMFTASCRREEVVAAIEAGANDYLVKPFAPGDLQRKLRKLLASITQVEAPCST